MSNKISRRYAKALFNLSVDEKVADKVYADLLSLVKLIPQSDEFQSFIDNPLIPAENRINLINQLFAKKLCKRTVSFLRFLAQKEQFEYLQFICEDFIGFYQEYINEKKAVITSACSVTKKQVADICAKLEKYFQCKFKSEVVVDPNMLGGFKVTVGDVVFDLTVRQQLNKYRQAVLTA